MLHFKSSGGNDSANINLLTDKPFKLGWSQFSGVFLVALWQDLNLTPAATALLISGSTPVAFATQSLGAKNHQ